MKKDKIKAYFEGSLSDNEKKEVENHMATTKAEATFKEVFEEKWEQSENYAEKEIFSDILFSEIESGIETKPTRPIRMRVFRYAAAVALLISCTWIVFKKEVGTPLVTTADVEQITKSTSKGQKSTIMLSDGSKVILNAESSLHYPKKFSDSSRVIHLTGEAFFEVVKDRSRPFSVIANDIRTTALGTSFNINAHEDGLKVSLATGKVVIKSEKENREQKYFLSPGEAISFGASEVLLSNFNFKKDLYWKDGVLYFENEAFETIISTLELWYDVSFSIENSPKEFKRYTGQFNNAPLSHVLENLGFSLGFDYFQGQKKVTLIFN